MEDSIVTDSAFGEYGDITPADFGVYEGTEEVLAPEDYAGGMMDFGKEEQYGLPEGTYNTRRGIALGDAVEDVGEAYAGLECEILLVSDTDEDGDYTWRDLAEYVEKNGTKATFAVTYSLYYVEGERMNWKQFYQYAEGGEHGGDGNELADAQGYSLTIVVRGGKVSVMSLSFADFNNM